MICAVVTRVVAGVLIAVAWCLPVIWVSETITNYIDWSRDARITLCLVPLIDTVSTFRSESLVIWSQSLAFGLTGALLWSRAPTMIRQAPCKPPLGLWFVLSAPGCWIAFLLVEAVSRSPLLSA
jgi:hypothetical protein